MQISFDTALTRPEELTAIIALCASLGGRLPDHGQTTNVVNISGVAMPEVAERVEAARGTTAPVVYADEVAEQGNDATSGTVRASEPAEAPATSAPTGSIDLDADGIPWDERIHASTKTKTQSGHWTKKRKVDEVLYGQVHAKLQEQYASGAEGKDEDVPPPPWSTNTGDESAPTDDTDVPPPPAPDVSGGFDTFADLVTAVGKFNLPMTKLLEIGKMATGHDLSKFFEVKDHPDAWGDVFDLAQAAAA